MQILVVVANSQVRTLTAKVEKGSMRTAIEHGSVDPKNRANVFGKAVMTEVVHSVFLVRVAVDLCWASLVTIVSYFVTI